MMAGGRSFRLLLAGSMLAALLRPSLSLGGAAEVKLKLPLRPKLAVTGHERLTLSPFLVASRLRERKDAARYKDLDLDGEFRRYLTKELSRRTKMTIVPAPASVVLPAMTLKELAGNAVLWKSVAVRTNADVVLSGIVDFKVEDKSGFRPEEFRSPLDGRVYVRQVMVEATGFTFEVTILAFDGRTGGLLFQETFRDTKQKPRRAADAMAGLFENLYSLENQLLGLFVVREREARRYVFD